MCDKIFVKKKIEIIVNGSRVAAGRQPALGVQDFNLVTRSTVEALAHSIDGFLGMAGRWSRC